MKNLLTLLGFSTAILLFVGVLHKSNYRVVQMGNDNVAAMEALDGKEAQADDEILILDDNPSKAGLNFKEVIGPASAIKGNQNRSVHQESSPRPSNRRINDADLQRWVNLHANEAIDAALEHGIPAGLSLTLGVQQLEAGQMHPQDNFAKQILAPLVNLKAKSKGWSTNYFKYSANSKSWFEGLEAIEVYSEAELKQIFRRYDLASYDAEVYLALTGKEKKENSSSASKTYTATLMPSVRKSESTAAVRPSDQEVAGEDLRNNMAYAMNRLSDRGLKEKGKEMNFKPRSVSTEKEMSRAMRIASSINLGKSKVFDKPAEFQAVLREVLALEADYPSWEAYLQADAGRAKRKFRQRSDVMALGGELRVTRKK